MAGRGDSHMDKIQSLEQEIFDDCWIVVLSFTKKDWSELELLASDLKDQGAFNSSVFKCIVGAVCLWTNNGNGIRESDH